MKVALGPEKNFPSWNWVGFDTSRELSKYFDVSTFSTYDSIPDAECVLVVKQLPPQKWVENLKKHDKKVLYIPIDYFLDQQHVDKSRATLKLFDGIISHCETLSDVLSRYCKKIRYVDHNNKFALPEHEMIPYRPKGHVVWVGSCTYVAYLCHWLRKHPIQHPVKIVADFDNDRARFAANKLATHLGISLRIQSNSTSIDGHECHAWSERTQYEIMREAKASIDIKGTNDFNQLHKPPTKGQKYVASGIPFATNPGTYVGEYFFKRGLKIPSPLAQDRWFSEAYWKETREFSKKLRVWTSIENVGKIFKEAIER